MVRIELVLEFTIYRNSWVLASKYEWWDVGVVVCMGCRLAYSPADATATHYLLLQ